MFKIGNFFSDWEKRTQGNFVTWFSQSLTLFVLFQNKCDIKWYLNCHHFACIIVNSWSQSIPHRPVAHVQKYLYHAFPVFTVGKLTYYIHKGTRKSFCVVAKELSIYYGEDFRKLMRFSLHIELSRPNDADGSNTVWL